MALLIVCGVLIAWFAGPASAAPAPATPTGYQSIAEVFDVAAGAQSGGTVRCPPGSVPVSGGANAPNPADDLGENINSSFPSADGRGWRARVSNAGGSDSSYAVVVVCVRGLQRYSIVTGAEVDNPAGTVTRAVARCPSDTVVFGGGGSTSSQDTAVNLVRSYPAGPAAWRVDVGNASSAGDTVTPFAVCAETTASYQRVAGTRVGVRPGRSVLTLVQCPAGSTALGGGASTTSESPLSTINATLPGDRYKWTIGQNNQTIARDSVTAYVICSVVN